MVFQDLSSSSSTSFKTSGLKIAPVSDRVMAFFFDVILLGPLCSILLSSLLQKLEIRYYTSPGSAEFMVLLGLTVLAYAILTIVGQTAFLTLWGATPGKYFFKLRVVSVKGPERLSFDQALLRSFVWVIEFCSLCLPFFEVMSHPKRRPIHDRAAETMVVTLKDEGDPGPMRIEGHFIKHILLTMACILGFWSLLFFGKLYRMTLRGDFKKAELIEQQYLCDHVSRSSENSFERLDITLAKYIAGETDQDCLLNEADFALWTNNEELKPMAYLAKGFHFQYDRTLSKKYLQKACADDKNSEVCAIAKYLLRESGLPAEGKTLTLAVLDVQLVFSQMDLRKLNQRISSFPLKGEFQSYLQNFKVMSYWANNQKERAMGAYSNSLAFMNENSKLQISSWMCLEQTDEACLNKSYESCDELRDILREDPSMEIDPETMLALARESQCKKADTFPHHVFRGQLSKYPWLRLAMESLDHHSEMKTEERLEVFKKIANTSEVPVATRLRFLNWYVQNAPKTSDLSSAVTQLKKFPHQDWLWSKAMSQVASRAKTLKAGVVADITKSPTRAPAQADSPQLKPATESP